MNPAPALYLVFLSSSRHRSQYQDPPSTEHLTSTALTRLVSTCVPTQRVAHIASADNNASDEVADEMLDWSLAGQKALQAMEESEDISEEMKAVETDQQLNRQALTIATTTPFDEISPTDLKTFLHDNSRVEIRWRGESLTDGTYDHRIISTDYPASVAYACSGFCAARMKHFLRRTAHWDWCHAAALGIDSCLRSLVLSVIMKLPVSCSHACSIIVEVMAALHYQAFFHARCCGR